MKLPSVNSLPNLEISVVEDDFFDFCYLINTFSLFFCRGRAKE